VAASTKLKAIELGCRIRKRRGFPAAVCPRLKRLLLFRPLTRDLDFVIRFETLDDDFHTLCSHLAIRYEGLPRRNVNQREDYSAYYDGALVRMVGEKFPDEIDAFGNKFESPG
jgi:hypothetical protein